MFQNYPKDVVTDLVAVDRNRDCAPRMINLNLVFELLGTGNIGQLGSSWDCTGMRLVPQGGGA